ncbi:hypothetical protein FGB62_3g142 [Gracilaria domingensis]|nr:hypothetical protein FGB62_3g142 [Gracilaria domingensis]
MRIDASLGDIDGWRYQRGTCVLTRLRFLGASVIGCTAGGQHEALCNAAAKQVGLVALFGVIKAMMVHGNHDEDQHHGEMQKMLIAHATRGCAHAAKRATMTQRTHARARARTHTLTLRHSQELSRGQIMARADNGEKKWKQAGARAKRRAEAGGTSMEDARHTSTTTDGRGADAKRVGHQTPARAAEGMKRRRYRAPARLNVGAAGSARRDATRRGASLDGAARFASSHVRGRKSMARKQAHWRTGTLRQHAPSVS